MFAQFLKFFGKEYEEIKRIPVSRLWGYFDYMERYYKDSTKTPQDIKSEKVADVDWDDEVKELKLKESKNG